jgi:transposase
LAAVRESGAGRSSAEPPAGDARTGASRVSATAILAELGDCRRFSSSDDAVRHAGLDITVYQSDEKRAPGHLSHEGPAVWRWAL